MFRDAVTCECVSTNLPTPQISPKSLDVGGAVFEAGKMGAKWPCRRVLKSQQANEIAGMSAGTYIQYTCVR